MKKSKHILLAGLLCRKITYLLLLLLRDVIYECPLDHLKWVPADGVDPKPDISKFEELIDLRISPEPRFESSLPLSNLEINRSGYF